MTSFPSDLPPLMASNQRGLLKGTLIENCETLPIVGDRMWGKGGEGEREGRGGSPKLVAQHWKGDVLVQVRGRREQNNCKRAPILHQSQNDPKVGEKGCLERARNRVRARQHPVRGGSSSGGQGQRIDFTGEQAADPAPLLSR